MTAPHRFSARVYHEDVDLLGVVYHANYLRYAERARSEMLRARLGGHAALKDATSLLLAVCEMQINFRRPARLEDDLTVETRLDFITKARFGLDQAIKRGDELLCAMKVVIACIDADGRPRRLPDILIQALGP